MSLISQKGFHGKTQINTLSYLHMSLTVSIRTAWSSVLLRKIAVAQLVENFPLTLCNMFALSAVKQCDVSAVASYKYRRAYGSTGALAAPSGRRLSPARADCRLMLRAPCSFSGWICQQWSLCRHFRESSSSVLDVALCDGFFIATDCRALTNSWHECQLCSKSRTSEQSCFSVSRLFCGYNNIFIRMCEMCLCKVHKGDGL